jgi:hypothetical protein
VQEFRGCYRVLLQRVQSCQCTTMHPCVRINFVRTGPEWVVKCVARGCTFRILRHAHTHAGVHDRDVVVPAVGLFHTVHIQQHVCCHELRWQGDTKKQSREDQNTQSMVAYLLKLSDILVWLGERNEDMLQQLMRLQVHLPARQ